MHMNYKLYLILQFGETNDVCKRVDTMKEASRFGDLPCLIVGVAEGTIRSIAFLYWMHVFIYL